MMNITPASDRSLRPRHSYSREFFAYFVATVVITPLFADVFHGYLATFDSVLASYIGPFIRGSVVVLTLATALFWSRYTVFLSAVLIALLGLGAFSIFLGVYLGNGKAMFMYDAAHLAKTLFPVSLLSALVVYGRIFAFGASFYLSLIELAVAILVSGYWLSLFLELSMPTYGDYAFGTKGLFAAQNDLSLALVIGLIILVYRLASSPTLGRLVFVVITLAAMVQVGTRASLIGTLLSPSVGLLVYLVSKDDMFVRRNARQVVARTISIPVIFVIASLGAGYATVQMESYELQSDKLKDIVNVEHPRARLISMAFVTFDERSRLFSILAPGPSRYETRNYENWGVPLDVERKKAEVDWVDLYGSYGLVFVILLYGVYLVVLIHQINRVVRRRPAASLLAVIAVSVFLGHSAIAGHALSSPLPATLLVLVIAASRMRTSGAKQSDRANLVK